MGRWGGGEGWAVGVAIQATWRGGGGPNWSLAFWWQGWVGLVVMMVVGVVVIAGCGVVGGCVTVVAVVAYLWPLG